MSMDELLLAFYGDDFTGSTDAMEALTIHGYRTVLFLEPPSAELLADFDGLRCFGVAGTSRAKSPANMERELRPVFSELAKIRVPLIHYKTCSTFDSSPEIGSIGKAIELSREYFTGHQQISVLVGAPALGRYTFMGNHFARMGDTVYRLDRHPTMATHPVTPMTEADLRLHLQKQTSEKIELMSIFDLSGSYAEVKDRFEKKMADEPGLCLFDVIDDQRLLHSAQLIWDGRTESPQFIVGSSGWEYAFTSFWAGRDLASPVPPLSQHAVKEVEQILVVSGSCSPLTEDQISFASNAGFRLVKIPIHQITDLNSLSRTFVEEILALVKSGENVLLYTAAGQKDNSIALAREHFKAKGIALSDTGEVIGRYLGRVAKEVVDRSAIRRIVVAGGDTSGFVTKELGVYGLEMICPISPGAPLCKGYTYQPNPYGLELALKGGQMGEKDYFVRALNAGK